MIGRAALQKYRQLNLSTKNLQDRDRRPFYLAQFTSSVLRHHKPGEEQDLNEAQLLVDDLRQIQPDVARDLGPPSRDPPRFASKPIEPRN